jgi:hypothetical protein
LYALLVLLSCTYSAFGTTVDLHNSVNITGSAPTAGYLIYDGQTRLFFAFEWSTDVRTPHQVQLMGAALAATYTLQNDIDFEANSSFTDEAKMWGTNRNIGAGRGFVSLGDAATTSESATADTAFTGTINGDHYSISNFYIDNSNTFVASTTGAYHTALVSINTGTIQNLSLHGDITSDSRRVGLITGFNNGGTIQNVITSGSVEGWQYTGGVAGYSLNNGIIEYAANYADVTNPTAGGTGGIVGLNSHENGKGTVRYSMNAGTISGNNRVGGLVGYNYGIIHDSYNIGSVIGGNITGGIAGNTGFSTTISGTSIYRTYNSGSVTGTGSSIGAIVGLMDDILPAGNVTNNLYDNQTSIVADGCPVGAGTGSCTGVATEKTTAELMLEATFTAGGWSDTAGVTGSIDNTELSGTTAPNFTWFLFEGETRPMLMGEYSTTIKTPHALQLAATTTGADYVLHNNIDMSDAFTNTSDVWATNKNSNAGKGFVPIGLVFSSPHFQGSLDGQNYVIDNLYINRPATSYIGLFSSSSGLISNLGVTNVDVTGQDFSGTIAGIISGTVDNSYTSGKFTTTGSASGGFIGLSDGTITNSHSSTNVFTSGTTAIAGIGGFIGSNRNGVIISDSYATGNVTISNPNSWGIGGFVGNNSTDIIRSYSTGTVSTLGIATSYVGGFVGQNGRDNNATISDSYSSSRVNHGAGTDTVVISRSAMKLASAIMFAVVKPVTSSDAPPSLPIPVAP